MVLIAGGIAILAIVKPWRRDDDDDDEPDDTPTAVISMKPIKRPSPKVKAGPRPGRPQPGAKSSPRPDVLDDPPPSAAPRAKAKPSSGARTRGHSPHDEATNPSFVHVPGAQRKLSNGHDYGTDPGFGGGQPPGNGHGRAQGTGAERMLSNGHDYGTDPGFGGGQPPGSGHGPGAERVVGNGHDYGVDLGFGAGHGSGNSQARRHRVETISRARRVPPAPGREEITLPDWLGPVSGPR
ncbi:hypothetical protein [Catelliglobosispora koreensis]|uniref:hypothetical protein n=1 Tax=Catelliglobosispora koreensis TaxID=129052 RepID=UPI0003A996FF|nr:hypothetical protein [Catelliglobosispora koreensis]